MDNKLSELSKPVAWKLHHHDRYYFEENADVVAIAESMGQAKGDAVYSQEYVSALLEDNERVARELVARNGEIEGLRKRAAELEAIRSDASQVLKEIGNELGCNPDNESIMMAIDKLKERLATPVRLPTKYSLKMAGDKSTRAMFSGHNSAINDSADAIRAAGFTVEGDEQ